MGQKRACINISYLNTLLHKNIYFYIAFYTICFTVYVKISYFYTAFEFEVKELLIFSITFTKGNVKCQ